MYFFLIKHILFFVGLCFLFFVFVVNSIWINSDIFSHSLINIISAIIAGCIYVAVASSSTVRPLDFIFKDLADVDSLNKSLLSSVPFGITIVDGDGKIIFLNDYFLKKFGRESIGCRRWDVIKCENGQCENCPLTRNIKVGETVITDVAECLEGKTYELTRTGMMFRGQKAYLEIFRDITRRKKMENELRVSSEKIRSIFEYSPLGLSIIDKDSVVLDCNESHAKIVGASRNDVIGLNILEKVQCDGMKTAVRDCLSGKVGFYQGDYTSVAGKKRMIMRAQFGPVFDEGGKVVGGIQIIDDVTHSEGMKKDLAENVNKLEFLTSDLKKFKLAVDSASDPIAIIDQNGKVMYVNKMGEEMSGYGPGELIGLRIKTWKLDLPADEIGKGKGTPIQEIWDKADSSNYLGELAYKTKDGQIRSAEFRIAPAFNEMKEIQFYVATMRDITKAKEIDRAKTEFVSLASHQLRTPLSAISLASELLLRGSGGQIDAKQKKYLGEIYSSTKNMSSLINDLLNISRIELGTMNINLESLSVSEQLDEIIRNLSLQFKEKRLKVVNNFTEDLPPIVFDKNAFSLIVDNLLTNAIRYSPVGGRVRVTARAEKKAVVIEISDNGCGIPANESKKIFTKLYRASNAKEICPGGEGLGLYIAKSIADRAGTKLWFESNDNDPGTTFLLSIPISI